AQDREDDALGGFGLVPEELGRPDLLAQREPIGLGRLLSRADPGGARPGASLLHLLIELVDIDGDAARPQDVLRQVERKAIGIVKRESDAAVERLAVLQPLAGSHLL